VLFVFEVSDTALDALLQRLIAGLPPERARIVRCKKLRWPHPKVSKLIEAYPLAAHEIVVISDGDVWVPKDFLAQTVPAMLAPGAGLVNSFYSLARPSTLALRWASTAINADFWGQVLQSNALKSQDFALGAAMMTTRQNVNQIGGFESFADFLADDYQLGNRIAGLDKRIVLSPVVVECRPAPAGWRQVGKHQLRQARNIRVCQPLPFFFSILSNGTLWPLLWVSLEPRGMALTGAILFVAVRILTALHNEYRLTRTLAHLPSAWFIPIKDLLDTAVWALAFLGNSIDWRGSKYRVLPGGKLVRQKDQPSLQQPARDS
jgi:ceramide glucosyltransferase